VKPLFKNYCRCNFSVTDITVKASHTPQLRHHRLKSRQSQCYCVLQTLELNRHRRHSFSVPDVTLCERRVQKQTISLKCVISFPTKANIVCLVCVCHNFRNKNKNIPLLRQFFFAKQNFENWATPKKNEAKYIFIKLEQSFLKSFHRILGRKKTENSTWQKRTLFFPKNVE
jgi:hypothetical protein